MQSSSPSARLVWFVAGLVLLLAALETFERRHSALIVAASHRGLTKAAMFDRHPRVNLLFLGTSRAQDGVSPDLVTRGLQAIAPDLGELLGFNAAFTGSSLGALVSLAPRFDRRSELRAVIIELSEPQIFKELVPWDAPVRTAATFEERLGDLVDHAYVVRYRKAWLAGNLGRLPSLFAAASMGGWETKGGEQLASWLGRKEAAATGFDPARWVPARPAPSEPAPSNPLNPMNPPMDEASIALAEQLASLAGQFRAHGITPVFAVPPLASSERDAPERHELRALFAEVERRCQCEVWNFAPIDLPDAYFRDASHLNREGRAQYSEALARELARILKAG